MLRLSITCAPMASFTLHDKPAQSLHWKMSETLGHVDVILHQALVFLTLLLNALHQIHIF